MQPVLCPHLDPLRQHLGGQKSRLCNLLAISRLQPVSSCLYMSVPVNIVNINMSVPNKIRRKRVMVDLKVG